MNWALNRYILPCQFVVFAYRKTNTKTSGKSQNVNGRSLSTFDSSVSCLYFFDSEYICQNYVPIYQHTKNTEKHFPVFVQLHCHMTDDVKKQQK